MTNKIITNAKKNLKKLIGKQIYIEDFDNEVTRACDVAGDVFIRNGATHGINRRKYDVYIDGSDIGLKIEVYSEDDNLEILEVKTFELIAGEMIAINREVDFEKDAIELRKAVRDFYEVLETLGVREKYKLIVSVNYGEDTYEVDFKDSCWNIEESSVIWMSGEFCIETRLYEGGYIRSCSAWHAIEFVKDMTADLKLQSELDLKKEMEKFEKGEEDGIK